MHRHGFPPVLYFARGDDPALAERSRASAAPSTAWCASASIIDAWRMCCAMPCSAADRSWRCCVPGRRRSSCRDSVRSTIRGHRFVRETRRSVALRWCIWRRASVPATWSCSKCCATPPRSGIAHTQFARFLQEYELISRIRHPNVVRILRSRHCGRSCLHRDGVFSARRSARHIASALRASEALKYLAQMAGALQVVHAVGVLHRDLKPGNIMMRADGSLAHHRLRAGEARGPQCRHDGHRRDFRHAVLHESGAGARPGSR